MTAKEYQYWVIRLAQYDPRDNKYDDPRSVAYREMIRCNVPLEDRVAIDKDAIKLFEERKLKGREITNIWVDELSDPWGPTGRYGKSIPQQLALDRATLDRLWREIVDLQFNTEGEKQMEKIDWHKPLRAFKTPSHEIVDAKVYTYKSGKQRVVWIDDRVYQVDEQGHAVADVDYGAHWVRKGDKIVENVPEEKFFLGLARDSDGTYWLTDDGMPTTMNVLGPWKQLMTNYQPHWIVDTRKPAEPPKKIEYDPKDWTVVKAVGNRTVSTDLLTGYDAQKMVANHGGVLVRVRNTPATAPIDTARYIQLWRLKESHPWRINAHGPAVGGSQEFTWAETRHRGTNPTQCAIKVRD